MRLDFCMKLIVFSDGLFLLSIKDTCYVISKIKPPDPQGSVRE
jgi:hypothetical protein